MRYKAIEGSQSSHCCFTATVIDATKRVMAADGRELDWFESVCECWSIDDAERIASALNATIP